MSLKDWTLVHIHYIRKHKVQHVGHKISLPNGRLLFPSLLPHRHSTHMQCGHRPCGSWWCQLSSRRRTGTSSPRAQRAPPPADGKSRCSPHGQSDLGGYKEHWSELCIQEGRKERPEVCLQGWDLLMLCPSCSNKDMKEEKQQFVRKIEEMITEK